MTDRDYKKEYKDFHGKPEQIKLRSQRNHDRYVVKGLKVGDPRVVVHKKPLSEGGAAGDPKNLKVVSKKEFQKEQKKKSSNPAKK